MTDPLHVDLRPFIKALAEALVDAMQLSTPAAQPAKRLYTMREAARELSCSLRTLERWVALGVVRSTRMGKRSVRISEAEIRRCLEENYDR